MLATFKPHYTSHCVAGIEIGLIRCYTIYINMVWATLLFTKEDDLVLSRPEGSLLKRFEDGLAQTLQPPPNKRVSQVLARTPEGVDGSYLPGAGFEPARGVTPADFKSAASSLPPPRPLRL